MNAESVKRRAREAGFDLCGITNAVHAPRLARLAEWIAEAREALVLRASSELVFGSGA